jgi:hypothetical protein
VLAALFVVGLLLTLSGVYLNSPYNPLDLMLEIAADVMQLSCPCPRLYRQRAWLVHGPSADTFDAMTGWAADDNVARRMREIETRETFRT